MCAVIPPAIWMPSRHPSCLPSVYRGSPVEMVSAMAEELGEGMAEELGEGITVLEAIDTLAAALEDNRAVHLPVPQGRGPEQLARWFVGALLDAGVSRPLSMAA